MITQQKERELIGKLTNKELGKIVTKHLGQTVFENIIKNKNTQYINPQEINQELCLKKNTVTGLNAIHLAIQHNEIIWIPKEILTIENLNTVTNDNKFQTCFQLAGTHNQIQHLPTNTLNLETITTCHSKKSPWVLHNNCILKTLNNTKKLHLLPDNIIIKITKELIQEHSNLEMYTTKELTELISTAKKNIANNIVRKLGKTTTLTKQKE
jgi:hypothetical protein